MIQSFQKFSKSPIAKAFLLVVALSFGAFFGGSQYFMSDNRRAVAEVGDVTVSLRDFSLALEQERRALKAHTDQEITLQQMAQTGIVNSVLQSLIDNALLDQEAQTLGLAVSNMDVLNTIHSVKAFQNDQGKFDRDIFDRILYSNSMTEDTYVEEIEATLIRQQLAEAVMAGAFAPKLLSDTLLDGSYQTRQGATLLVDPQKMTSPTHPGNEVLEAFYTEQKDSFMQPEHRSFTALFLTPKAVMKDIEITDEDIQTEYETLKEELGNKPLAKVKAKVMQSLTRQVAADKLYELSQQLEDTVAGGSTLEEVAKEYDLKLVTVENATLAHTTVEGAPLPTFVKDEGTRNQVIAEVFSAEEGLESTFTETSNGEYFIVRTDKVTPAQPLVFAEIKDQVFKEWANVQQIEEAYQKAERIADDITTGRGRPMTMKLLPNIVRSNPPKDIPDAVLGLLYALSPGQAAVAPTDEGFVVVMLKKIIPPSRTVLNAEREKIEGKTTQLLQTDALQSYLRALRIRYPVKVNWQLVGAVLER